MKPKLFWTANGKVYEMYADALRVLRQSQSRTGDGKTDAKGVKDLQKPKESIKASGRYGQDSLSND
tara:strand:- start:1194 stop:1391 length:198 start_codon:yes stop_codon:yes gene_type:complete